MVPDSLQVKSHIDRRKASYMQMQAKSYEADNKKRMDTPYDQNVGY